DSHCLERLTLPAKLRWSNRSCEFHTASVGPAMKKSRWCFVLFWCLGLPAFCDAAETPKAIVESLVNPESVCIGPNGQLYVTEIGEFEKKGDGKVSVIKDGKPQPFAEKLDDPKGIVFY